MTLVTLPYNPVEDDAEDVSELMANFTAILAVLNGDIRNDNIASAAAIAASKIVRDTDVALTANSDTVIASQKAVKTYADTKLTIPGAWTPYSSVTSLKGMANPSLVVALRALQIGTKTVQLSYSLYGTANNDTTGYCIGFTPPILGVGNDIVVTPGPNGWAYDTKSGSAGTLTKALSIAAAGSLGLGFTTPIIFVQSLENGSFSTSGIITVEGQIVYELA